MKALIITMIEPSASAKTCKNTPRIFMLEEEFEYTFVDLLLPLFCLSGEVDDLIISPF